VPKPGRSADAPADFIKAQLRGIVGSGCRSTRIDAKKKMSQNRKLEDRAGVIAGLGASDNPDDREVAAMIRRAEANSRDGIVPCLRDHHRDLRADAGPAMLYARPARWRDGRRAVLMASLGLHLGGYVHVIAAAAGLALLFHAVPPLFWR